MDPFKCHAFEEAMDFETRFIRSHIQGYYTLINNIQRVGNPSYNNKLELKNVPKQTAQISETP